MDGGVSLQVILRDSSRRQRAPGASEISEEIEPTGDRRASPTCGPSGAFSDVSISDLVLQRLEQKFIGQNDRNFGGLQAELNGYKDSQRSSRLRASIPVILSSSNSNSLYQISISSTY